MRLNRSVAKAHPPRAPLAPQALEPRRLLAQLVADLDPRDFPSHPDQHVQVGPITYFTADDGIHGRELWKTDGTDAGTVLVKDVRPGPQSSNPVRLLNLNGTLLFAADDGQSGVELWRSDGTEDGTTLLLDINPNGSSNAGASYQGGPAGYPILNNLYYFGATEPGTGNELWVTDGTPEGTHIVVDLKPGTGGAGPKKILAVGQRILFEATPTTFLAVCSTDGTPEGTAVLTGTSNRPYAPIVNYPARSGNYLYFSSIATSPSITLTLWRTDGTPAGTVALKQTPGQFDNFADMNGTMVMFGSASGNGMEAWKSDGTPAGTVKVADVPGSLGPSVSLGNRVVYPVEHFGSPTWALWSTDGTPAGTAVIANFPRDVAPPMAVMNGVCYFAPDDGTGRQTLWRTDGTAAGTRAVSNDALAFGEGRVTLNPAGNRLWFAPSRPGTAGDGEPWQTDGTATGFRFVKNINRIGVGTFPQAGFELNGAYFFFTANGDLYRTAGTAGGTSIIRPAVRPGLTTTTLDFSAPTWFAQLGDSVYFTGQDGAGNGVMWKTDGTPAGTQPLASPAGNVQFPQTAPVVYNGGIYFTARDAAGDELWTSDGTPQGTYRLKDLLPTGDGLPGNFMVYRDLLYFWANAKDEANRSYKALWRTDGTQQGTVQVSTDPTFPRNGLPGMAIMADILYFFATGEDGLQLWRSDGDVQGTVPIQGFLSSRPPAHLTAAGNRLFFTQPGEQGGRWLWTSDGTVSGTHTLGTVDVVPPPTNSSPSNRPSLWAVGSQVFFRGSEFEGGLELWKSDGTDAGTVRVKDIVPGPDGSSPVPMIAADGLLFFSATDPAGGRELWKTDGTEPGTVRVDDINPGPANANPINAAFINDGPLAGNVFFTAATDATGPELWVTPTGVPRAPRVAGRHVFYNGSAFDGNDPAASAADDGAVAPNKSALLPGQAGSFSNVTSYSRGLNGIMVDIANLPAGGVIGAADFDFNGARAPKSVTLRRGAGVAGSDRVTLTWDDAASGSANAAVANSWLRVTVRATSNTGLAAPDAFAFGNLVGETGNPSPGGRFGVNTIDAFRLRGAARAAASAPVSSAFDFNRDGAVNRADDAILRANYGRVLSPTAVPPAVSALSRSRRRRETDGLL